MKRLIPVILLIFSLLNTFWQAEAEEQSFQQPFDEFCLVSDLFCCEIFANPQMTRSSNSLVTRSRNQLNPIASKEFNHFPKPPVAWSDTSPGQKRHGFFIYRPEERGINLLCLPRGDG